MTDKKAVSGTIKDLQNRGLAWWEGLSPSEQKLYAGVWGAAAALLVIILVPDSGWMLLVFGAVGGYFWMKFREAKGAEGGDAAKPAAASPAAAPKPAAPAKPAAAKPAAKAEAKPAKAEAKPAAKAEAKPAAKAKADSNEPERLSKPKGKADDLKMLKGVGPKLESILNEMGFYHYSQIASWTPAQVAWVDEAMSGVNRGRASRDGWVEQAKILASGGETAFSARVEAGEVPTSR